MEVSPETAFGGRTNFSWGRFLALMFFGLMLAGFGVIFILVGCHAIKQRSYDMEWHQSRGFFFGIGGIEKQSSDGVEHYRGASAVRVGAGFISFGALLALWGSMIMGSMWRPSRAVSGKYYQPHCIGLVLGLVSFGLLLAAQGCLFPIWQTNGLVFWSVVVGMAVIVVLLARAGKGRWTGIPFMVLAILAIAIPAPGISFALVMGIFGTLFCGAHLVFLFPDYCLKKLDRPGHG